MGNKTVSSVPLWPLTEFLPSDLFSNELLPGSINQIITSLPHVILALLFIIATEVTLEHTVMAGDIG